MISTSLIRIYHSFEGWSQGFKTFLSTIAKGMKRKKMIFWLSYANGQFFYSYTANESTKDLFESKFYSYFNNFQLQNDDGFVWKYDKDKTVVGEILLENSWFFPFKMTEENTDFVSNIFRVFENFDVISDKLSYFIELEPIVEESFWFFIKAKVQYSLFKMVLSLKFFKYLFNLKVKHGWKKEGEKYFKSKLWKDLFKGKIYIICQAKTRTTAKNKIESIGNTFLNLKNYPLNKFHIHIHTKITGDIEPFSLSKKFKSWIYSYEEIGSFFHFPKASKQETSLLKVKSKKLALPNGIPTFDYDIKWKSIIAKNYPRDVNIIGVSDFRSTQVPVGIYDEDRLKHLYIIGKTWVGKSKFITSLVKDDLQQGKGIWLIDPHGDLIDEIMTYIPDSRKDDVIIFDPSDEQFPFCLNPLDIKKDESKQILAKGFIDIFKKFFWANWNPKLEHVLRMIFLALLDKKEATIFDIIRALTDKNFRYDMIESITDDVVRNFWTNEFAAWSQQFNTEAIMPILNKVGQILSIEAIKNIFSSTKNKLDFRQMMDEKKILLVKLSKWKLQEEIMWFLWAMFVTKLYQAAMSRQNIPQTERTPFFLYIDEFQNFATETFGEILSEARKYWLGLTVAHQFVKQIPDSISQALFWNVGTMATFRISSEDALYMKQHFDPFIEAYDLANLNQREFYCKMLVHGQVKDPFSLKTLEIDNSRQSSQEKVRILYQLSRQKYARNILEAKKELQTSQKDIIEKIETFVEPIL